MSVSLSANGPNSNGKVHSEHESVSTYLVDELSTDERGHIGILSFNQWGFALAGVVEIALGVIELGSQVTIGLWANDTPLKEAGWSTSHLGSKWLPKPAIDVSIEQALLGAGLKISNFARPPIIHWRPEQLPSVSKGITRSEVRALTYRGSAMGRAILQVHPDAKTPFREDFVWPTRWVRRASRSYAWVFDQTLELIRKKGLTTVVVFNGRFLHDNAAAAAAESVGVRVLYGETGGIDTDFDLSSGSTHEMDHVQRRMLAMYSTWPDARGGELSKEQIGETWFRNRLSHSDPEVQLFVGGQELGDLGEVAQVSQGERLVVFFSSSGDEIAELELNWRDFFDSQEGALLALAQACKDLPNTTLVVRTHPHLRIKPADDLARWTAAVEQAGVKLHIDPYSPVDSYSLMRTADVVVTYGSTSGVEAAFLGRPSILMGPSAYNLLGCATSVSSLDELNDAVTKEIDVDPELALPYGLFLQRRGFIFKHLERQPDGSLNLNGIVIREGHDFVRKLSHFFNQYQIRWLTKK